MGSTTVKNSIKLQLFKQSVSYSYSYNYCKRKSMKSQLQVHKAEPDIMEHRLPALVRLFFSTTKLIIITIEQ